MICPYCREGLDGAGPSAVACGACGTALHAACALLHGGCVTYGCSSRVLRPTDLRAVRPRRVRPPLPASVSRRRRAQAALEVILAPREDVALVVLALLAVGALLVR